MRFGVIVVGARHDRVIDRNGASIISDLRVSLSDLDLQGKRIIEVQGGLRSFISSKRIGIVTGRGEGIAAQPLNVRINHAGAQSQIHLISLRGVGIVFHLGICLSLQKIRWAFCKRRVRIT